MHIRQTASRHTEPNRRHHISNYTKWCDKTQVHVNEETQRRMCRSSAATVRVQLCSIHHRCVDESTDTTRRDVVVVKRRHTKKSPILNPIALFFLFEMSKLTRNEIQLNQALR